MFNFNWEILLIGKTQNQIEINIKMGESNLTSISVTKSDILQACKEMLCKELYVVFTTPTKGLGPVMENLEQLKSHWSLFE